MDIILLLLIIMQIELLVILGLFVYHIIFSHYHHTKDSKKDKLIRHVKDYISDGLTLKQVRKKLEGIGFSDTRIDRVLQDFLKE